MADRIAQITAFLNRVGWAGANLQELAGDASARRYYRLVDPTTGARAVLMDAPAASGQDLAAFLSVAEYLAVAGLNAPDVYARDLQDGFLLLQDFGDDLFARVIAAHPEIERELYLSATDVLLGLHECSPPDGLTACDPAHMAELTGLAFEWYADPCRADLRQRCLGKLTEALEAHAAECSVMVLRDYHAENLIWLPDQTGLARVGLLDFQDAMVGHVAYDLVSLLQDARRDVSDETVKSAMDRYLRVSGQNREVFEAAFAVLGTQRNLRILGIFARLCLRDGKQHYVDLIPRVWNYLMNNLQHPALSDLGPVLKSALPVPDAAFLQGMKHKCPMP